MRSGQQACKPASKVAVDGFTCKKCDIKSTFKYNLKRHIDKNHDGNDESEAVIDNIDDKNSSTVYERHEVIVEQITLKEMLKDIKLDFFIDKVWTDYE